MEAVSHLADVPVAVEVELGRLNLRLRDLLGLGPGSAVALPRAAGENLDVRVGGALVGYGEVIVTESAVAIRITDLRGEG